MDYFELSKLLEETYEEIKEPADESSVIADWTHKLFNQGAHILMSTALLKIAKSMTSKGD